MLKYFEKLDNQETPQNFTLTVNMKDENFEQSVDIITTTKRYSVFIQTDKFVYKPSDKIQFRILIVDNEKKPFKVKKL